MKAELFKAFSDDEFQLFQQLLFLILCYTIGNMKLKS